jgi:hypothetical protein
LGTFLAEEGDFPVSFLKRRFASARPCCSDTDLEKRAKFDRLGRATRAGVDPNVSF